MERAVDIASSHSKWVEAGSIPQFARLIAPYLPTEDDQINSMQPGVVDASAESEPYSVEVVVQPSSRYISNQGIVFHFSQLRYPQDITYSEYNPQRPSLPEAVARGANERRLRDSAQQRIQQAQTNLQTEPDLLQRFINMGSRILQESVGTRPLTPGHQELEDAVKAQRYTEELISAATNLQAYETAQVRLEELQQQLGRALRRNILIRPVYLDFGAPEAIEEVEQQQGKPDPWIAPEPHLPSFHPWRRYPGISLP